MAQKNEEKSCKGRGVCPGRTDDWRQVQTQGSGVQAASNWLCGFRRTTDPTEITSKKNSKCGVRETGQTERQRSRHSAHSEWRLPLKVMSLLLHLTPLLLRSHGGVLLAMETYGLSHPVHASLQCWSV